MKHLTPLTLKDHYYAPIEAIIRAILNDLIYLPLVAAMNARAKAVLVELKNSRDPLRDAIADGTIWYEDSQFKGSFNAKTSAAIIKLGGAYNVKARTYSLPRDKVPVDLRIAQEHANMRYEAMRTKMLGVLDDIDLGNTGLGALKLEYEKTLEEMDKDLQKTLPRKPFNRVDNPAVESISIAAKMTADQKRIIAEEWANNLELYIKDWADDNILKLRAEIQPHVMAGGRAKGLEKTIRENYGVGARKAKFLARQETALLMSKFQQTRYQDIGIDKYKWSDSHDVRVRHDHHELQGKVFSWDDPPISNKRTGARNHPGEDFNCRCIAIPVVD